MIPAPLLEALARTRITRMAVRFQCGKCHQPIEADDEWAGRDVRCPYCHQAVTAPLKSTLMVTSDGGAGRLATVPSPPSLAHGGDASDASTFVVERSSRPAGGATNPAATTAAVLAGLLLCLSIGMVVITWINREELRRYNVLVMDLVEKEGVGLMQAHQTAAQRHDPQSGGLSASFLLLSLIQVSAMGVWLATIIAAAIGLRRRTGRGLAIGAMVVALASPVLCCTGALISLPLETWSASGSSGGILGRGLSGGVVGALRLFGWRDAVAGVFRDEEGHATLGATNAFAAHRIRNAEHCPTSQAGTDQGDGHFDDSTGRVELLARHRPILRRASPSTGLVSPTAL